MSQMRHKLVTIMSQNLVYVTRLGPGASVTVNAAYGNNHDPERAYLPEQRMQVDSVDSAFDCGFVEVKVPGSQR